VDAGGADVPADQSAGEFAGPVFLGTGHENLASGVIGSIEERHETGASAGIEFAHDIIDEEDGRGTEEAGEVFGLGHFQGDGQGPFLAFAGEMGGGLVVEVQLEIIPVGADECGFEEAFAGGDLG
jgi:hypothetical protein